MAPDDAEGLADALERLAREPGLSNQLAKRGRAHVLEQFNIETCLEPLGRAVSQGDRLATGKPFPIRKIM